MQPHVQRWHQTEIFEAHVQGLTDASGGVIEEEQQRVVATATSALLIRLREDHAHVLRFEILRGADAGSLDWNREYPLILAGPRQVMLDQMLEETVDRRQSTVATSDGVRALRFEMGQEREDCLDVQIV